MSSLILSSVDGEIIDVYNRVFSNKLCVFTLGYTLMMEGCIKIIVIGTLCCLSKNSYCFSKPCRLGDRWSIFHIINHSLYSFIPLDINNNILTPVPELSWTISTNQVQVDILDTVWWYKGPSARGKSLVVECAHILQVSNHKHFPIDMRMTWPARSRHL